MWHVWGRGEMHSGKETTRMTQEQTEDYTEMDVKEVSWVGMD
jgi:hypothetical protein